MKHAAILFFSILLFSICLGQGSLNNGLALHLPMDGNTTDVSGNAHQPIVRNISFGSNCSGIASQAAYFNGNNSMLEIPASIALNSTEKLTISFWVKTETNATQTIFSRAKAIPGEDPKYGYALELNTSKQPNTCTTSQHPSNHGCHLLLPPTAISPTPQHLSLLMLGRC